MTVIQSGVAETASGTTCAFTFSPSPQIGHKVVIWAHDNGATGMTRTVAFGTIVLTAIVSDDNTDAHVAVYERVIDGTEGATITFTGSATSHMWLEVFERDDLGSLITSAAGPARFNVPISYPNIPSGTTGTLTGTTMHAEAGWTLNQGVGQSVITLANAPNGDGWSFLAENTTRTHLASLETSATAATSTSITWPAAVGGYDGCGIIAVWQKVAPSAVNILHVSSYQATGDATSHTCTISPTPTAGHKLIAVSVKSASESSFSSGWTKVSGADDLDTVEQDQYEKWSDGTETSFAITMASGTACIDVYELSGMQNATSDVSTHNHSGSTPTSTPTTGTTAATADAIELVVAVFGYFASAVDTFTPPLGYTLLGHRASTNSVGNKTCMDVCYAVTTVAGTQSATGGYSVARTHRSANIATYKTASSAPPGKVYPKAKQSFLTQSPPIDIDTAVIRLAGGRIADGFSYNTTHQYFSDVVSVMVSDYTTAVTVPGISAPGGIVKSASLSVDLPISTGSPIDFCILFADGGTAATSPLIAYIPLVASVTPVAGKVIRVAFDTGSQVMAGLFAL